MAAAAPTTATFTDPTCGETCVLVVPPDGRIFPSKHGAQPKIGVAHPRCGQITDLSVELDAFYCRACGWSGRIPGAWALQIIKAGRC